MSDEAVPLVLVHGQLMTAEVWERLLPWLPRQPAHFADISSDASIAGMAGRLLADAPGRFDLVGYAMGGFVAFEVMRQAPDRVRRLVLMATLAEADNDHQRARRRGYARLVEAGEFERVAVERVPIIVSPDADDRDRLTEIVTTMARDTGPEIFLRQQQAILDRSDSRDVLPQITVPTLVIRGSEDAITSEAHFRRLVDTIPNARSARLEQCGHLLPLECPRRLAKCVVRWLGEEATD